MIQFSVNVKLGNVVYVVFSILFAILLVQILIVRIKLRCQRELGLWITCSVCNLQYVGETAQRVKDRFKNHRKGMKNPNKDNTSTILYKHFNSVLCKNATYNVQVFEVLNGNGRDINNNVDPEVTTICREKETDWMLKLRTVYPYGLNDRIGNEYHSSLTSTIAKRFP